MNKEEIIYPSMVIRSQVEAIELLQQENQQLKKELKAVRKGLSKVSVKRNKWKNRYYKEKMKNKQLKEVIEEVKDVIEKMIDVGYVDGMTCYYPTKNDSEFGVRAKILLQILDKGESNE